MQRAAGLYGLLIVDVKQGEVENFKYDGEINMLLSDWYHQDIYSQMVGLSSKPFRWVGEPQVCYFLFLFNIFLAEFLEFFKKQWMVGTSF
jgi:hypothetical protein